MGLYNDYYLPQPTQISMVQIVMTAAIVFVFAVLPITVIAEQRYQEELNSSVYTASALRQRDDIATPGRVAGASTSNTESILTLPFLNIRIDLGNEVQLLNIGGSSLIMSSVLIGIYLYTSTPKKKPHTRIKY